MSEPIVSVEDAVRELGALPVPVGDGLSEVERLRARVDEVERKYTFDMAELRRERDALNEALGDAAQCLRERQAEREALVERLRAGQTWRRGRNPELVSEDYVSQSELREIFGIPLMPPWGDAITQRLAPTQALRDVVVDGEHYASVHHTYRTPRDLPGLGGQR